MKKLWLLLGIIVLSFALVSCGGKNGNEDPKGGNEDPTDEKDIDIALDNVFQGFVKDKEIYLTTVGQSDIDIVQNILETATGFTEDVDFVRSELLTAAEVSNGSVVLLVTGTSGKGLGSAGTNVTNETNRAEAFATLANQGKITLIVIHVGGEARRGQNTDPVLNKACPGADLMLVVADGDKDDFFTNYNKNNSIPLYLFSKATKMVPAFQKIFE